MLNSTIVINRLAMTREQQTHYYHVAFSFYSRRVDKNDNVWFHKRPQFAPSLVRPVFIRDFCVFEKYCTCFPLKHVFTSRQSSYASMTKMHWNRTIAESENLCTTNMSFFNVKCPRKYCRCDCVDRRKNVHSLSVVVIDPSDLRIHICVWFVSNKTQTKSIKINISQYYLNIIGIK